MSMEDTLISKLIEETCADTSDSQPTGEVVNLQNYFEKKLNEVDFISLKSYLQHNDLQAEVMKFLQSTNCYRVVVNQSTLDFPSNWSIFQHIPASDLLVVDHMNDQDFLIDLFSELTGGEHHVAIAKEQEHIYLVFLPTQASDHHLKWMRRFFETKAQQEQKKTA